MALYGGSAGGVAKVYDQKRQRCLLITCCVRGGGDASFWHEFLSPPIVCKSL